MENTGLHDGVDIDVILSLFKLHQYSNMEYNNEYHYLFINDKMSISNNSSVFILNSPSISLKKLNYVHYKIQYTRISSIQIFGKLEQDLFIMQVI